MGLFRRETKPKTVSYFERYEKWLKALEQTTGRPSEVVRGTVRMARVQAGTAQAMIVTDEQSSERELEQIEETFDGLLAIAGKLDEVEKAMTNASADALRPVFWDLDFTTRVGISNSYCPPSATWKALIENAAASVDLWLRTVDNTAKRDWFTQMEGVRRKLTDQMLEAYLSLESLQQDIAFRRAATAAVEILPEFAIADAEATLITAADAAAEARALAESAAQIDVPAPLSALGEPGLSAEAPPAESLESGVTFE